MTPAEIVDAVRALHASKDFDPFPGSYCDACATDKIVPMWPCRTASLIYSQDEINETHAEHRRAEFRRALQRRERSAGGHDTR